MYVIWGIKNILRKCPSASQTSQPKRSGLWLQGSWPPAMLPALFIFCTAFAWCYGILDIRFHRHQYYFYVWLASLAFCSSLCWKDSEAGDSVALAFFIALGHPQCLFQGHESSWVFQHRDHHGLLAQMTFLQEIITTLKLQQSDGSVIQIQMSSTVEPIIL